MPKKKSTPNPFPPELLVSTEFRTADEKSRFGRALVAFVLGGFRRAKFTEPLYRRLCSCFGHIAEYGRGGFYAAWFADAEKQRKWVQHLLEYAPCGDPAFTCSDLERLFKAWLAVNREEVLRVIATKEARERAARVTEDKRRDALTGKTHQAFMVVAGSANVGAFGHTQFLMLAEDGCCYAVHHVQTNGAWQVGQIFDVPLDHDGLPTWEGLCVECPERRQDGPHEVVAKFWKKKVQIS